VQKLVKDEKQLYAAMVIAIGIATATFLTVVAYLMKLIGISIKG